MEIQTTNFDEIIKFNVTDSVIKELKDKYLTLKVEGFEDKKNYELVKEGHIRVKKLKAQIDARKKELKADALEFGRRVEGKYKEVMAPVLAIEEHLIEQRNIVDLEVIRRKEEAEQAEQKKIEERVSTFAKYGKALSFTDARNWTEPTYISELEVLKVNFETATRIAKENEEMRRKYEEEQAQRNIQLEQEQREAKRREKEAFDIQVAENKRLQAEIRAKEEAELKARLEAEKARAVALELSEDTALMQKIMEVYPTLQACWDELFRLKKNDIEVEVF